MLFNILKDHGHLFSRPFWTGVFDSVVFPIFTCVSDKRDMQIEDDEYSQASRSPHSEGSTWDSETSVVAAQCLVDLFVSFFDVIRSHLPAVVSILTRFIRSPVQGPASTGVAALMRLASDLGSRLSQDEWRDIFLALKEAATSSVPAFMKVLRSMDKIEVPDNAQSYTDLETSSDHIMTNDDIEDDDLQTAQYVVSRLKSHIAMQLLVVQVPPPISIHRYLHIYIYIEVLTHTYLGAYTSKCRCHDLKVRRIFGYRVQIVYVYIYIYKPYTNF